jgi:hypothetical protein
LAGADDSRGSNDPERRLGVVVVDGLARSYGWSRRDILHAIPVDEALELLGLVVEARNAEQRFEAALHGVELQDDGRGGNTRGIRGFHERIKNRWKGG